MPPRTVKKRLPRTSHASLCVKEAPESLSCLPVYGVLHTQHASLCTECYIPSMPPCVRREYYTPSMPPCVRGRYYTPSMPPCVRVYNETRTIPVPQCVQRGAYYPCSSCVQRGAYYPSFSRFTVGQEEEVLVQPCSLWRVSCLFCTLFPFHCWARKLFLFPVSLLGRVLPPCINPVKTGYKPATESSSAQGTTFLINRD